MFNFENVYIKDTPSGLIIEKGGKALSFEGKSAKLISRVLKQELEGNNSKKEVLMRLLFSIDSSNENIAFENKIKNLKKKTIFLFLSEDLISKSIIENFKKLNFNKIKIFNFPVKENIIDNKSADFIVAYHNSPEYDSLSSLNNLSLKNKIKFIKASKESIFFTIGPFVIPYETACYGCYAFLKEHNKIYDFDTLDKKNIKLYNSLKLSDIVSSFCAELFFLHIVNFFSNQTFHINDLKEINLNLNNFHITYNPLLKVPNCLDCNVQ